MDIGLSFCYLFRVARIRSRMIVQVDTIGIIPQVVRCEVEPEVGGGGLPVFGKRDGGPAGRAGAPRQRLHLGGVGGIETNDMYPVVIVSR